MAMETMVNSSGPWHTGKLMRVSIVISLLLHLFLVLGLHKTSLWPGFGEEIRVYEVELLRPSMEDLGDSKLTPSDLAQINKEQQEETKQADQETISLDTRDKRYVSYARVIKESIQRHWRYPPQAKENLIEGNLVVMFSMNPSGNLIGIRIITPSGFEILDQGIRMHYFSLYLLMKANYITTFTGKKVDFFDFLGANC